MLNILKQTQMYIYMYIWRIYSGRCIHIVVQLEDEIWIGIYTGLDTIAWIDMINVWEHNSQSIDTEEKWELHLIKNV